MKTRNELQREVKALQKALEEQKQIIIEKDKEIVGQDSINKNVSGWLSELETDYNALEYKYTVSENRLFKLKSKSLFQLIRWWFNAKN